METYIICGIVNKNVSFNVDELEKGKSLVMHDLDKDEYIKTTAIYNIFVDGNDVYVETKNRIYKFTKR